MYLRTHVRTCASLSPWHAHLVDADWRNLSALSKMPQYISGLSEQIRSHNRLYYESTRQNARKNWLLYRNQGLGGLGWNKYPMRTYSGIFQSLSRTRRDPENIMKEPVELEQLVNLAKGEDKQKAKDAMTRLFTILYPKIMGYLVKLCSSRELAEDVCQDTMVKIVTGLTKYRSSKSKKSSGFESWALTIATNAYRDHVKKWSRVVPVAEAPEIPNDQASPWIKDSEKEALDNVEFEEVLSILSLLPDEQKTVFILKTYYGYSYQEIGEIVGCPEGTAKSRLHKAVYFLRDQMRRRNIL